MQVHQIDVTEEVAPERLVMEVYRGISDGTVTTEHMGGSMAENRPGITTYLEAFQTNKSVCC